MPARLPDREKGAATLRVEEIASERAKAETTLGGYLDSTDWRVRDDDILAFLDELERRVAELEKGGGK